MPPTEPSFSTLPPDGPAPGLDRSPRHRQATAHFWIALIAGLCLVGVLALILVPGLAKTMGHSNTPNSLKQLGLVFRMYANESPGNRWPTLAANDRIWAPDLSVLYPEFLQDSSVLVAREHPEAEHIHETLRAVLSGPNPDYETAEGLMALSFAYIGYAVNSETEFDVIVQARASGLTDDPRETVHLPGSEKWVPPLNMDAMRCFGSNPEHPDYPLGINPTNPVIVEICAWKKGRTNGGFHGANVLFMDGHVEFVPLGTFPVVPSVMDALCGMTSKGF